MTGIRIAMHNVMNHANTLPRRPVTPYPRRACYVALLLGGLLGCADTQNRSPAGGEPFPLAEIYLTRSLGDDPAAAQGKTLVVNFWATWCAPCRKEMPELQRLSERLDPAKYAVIGISVDRDAHLAREFLIAHDIRFHVRHDPDLRLAKTLLGIDAFPVTFVVSPDAIVVERIDGALAAPPASLGIIASGESGPAAPMRLRKGG